VFGLGLFLLCAPASALEFPGPTPGPAQGSQTGSVWRLENRVVRGEWTFTNGPPCCSSTSSPAKPGPRQAASCSASAGSLTLLWGGSSTGMFSVWFVFLFSEITSGVAIWIASSGGAPVG
jgi:hypothetical protein